MARVSKKRKEGQILVSKRFHAGIYARLSVEADARKKESIEMQIALVKEYIRGHPEIELFDCYVDLGKTGTNFHREGFERMMEDVRKKRIDCIVVKDLSRFGRNHIETGNYIQKIFPFMGVRFIAVTDGIDTLQAGMDSDEIIMNLKNLVNELYAKDIAVKIKSSIQLRQEQGSYTGGVPPYGYMARWEDGKRMLFIREETAEIVKDIYEMYLSGKGLKQIVEVLYDRGIHRPAVCKRTGHVFWQEGEVLEQWGSTTVKQILGNPVYMGHDYYTYEAIINENTFLQTAAMLGGMGRKVCSQGEFAKKVPVSEDIYDGILFCGDCGKRMHRTINIKELDSGDAVRNYGYYCADSRRIDAFKCPPKSIGMAALSELVKNALQQEFLMSDLYQRRQEEKLDEKAKALEKQFRQEIAGCERKLKNKERQGSTLYIKYYTGEISLEEYQERREENKKWIQEISVKKENIRKKFHMIKQNVVEEKAALAGLIECREGFTLTREMLQTFIKRIEVYQNHQIKIFYADL